MTKKKIALVGGGQLGSRHLQSLAKLKEPAHITVIDPSSGALEMCQHRVREIPESQRHAYVFQQRIEDLSDIEFAVIATSAHVRRQVVEHLLVAAEVQFLLLEKVLFQTAQDCVEVGQRLKDKGIRAWVNAPRRMWPGYPGLRAFLAEEQVLGFMYCNTGWGLACNAYHMLDLFSWFTRDTIDTISPEFIDSPPRPSKRTGFFELTGTVTGRFESGCFFSMGDYGVGKRDSDLLISTQRRLFNVSETSGVIQLISGEALPSAVEALRVIPAYQSNLTHLVAESLFSSGSCGLTPYEEASDIHQKMLAAFATKFTPIQGTTSVCPIT